MAFSIVEMCNDYDHRLSVYHDSGSSSGEEEKGDECNLEPLVSLLKPMLLTKLLAYKT